jgi:hypothetical protein
MSEMVDDSELKEQLSAPRVPGPANGRERDFNRLMFGFTLTSIIIFVGIIAALVVGGLLIGFLLWLSSALNPV